MVVIGFDGVPRVNEVNGRNRGHAIFANCASAGAYVIYTGDNRRFGNLNKH